MQTASICFTIFFFTLKGSLGGEFLSVGTKDNKTNVFVELLRGRDGLPGRDGVQGPRGLSGERGLVGKEGSPGPSAGGETYVRWGNSSCPDVRDTTMVYSGMAAGSWFGTEGGGANYLCMPHDPEYSSELKYRTTTEHFTPIFGAEYEHPVPGTGTQDHNVPCAVCRVQSRSTVLMIPAKASCPLSWTREYYGYLMTEYKGTSSNIRGRTMFVCVDKGMQSLPGSSGDSNGALFYHTEAGPSGLPSPPYNLSLELNCVVCSK